MKSRGVVLTRQYETHEQGFATHWHPIDPALLRFYALYWDKIDIPATVIGGDAQVEQESSDLRLLKQEGMLTQTRGLMFIVNKDKGEVYESFSGERPLAFSALSAVASWRYHTSISGKWHWSIDPSALPINDHIAELQSVVYLLPDLSPIERNIVVDGNLLSRKPQIDRGPTVEYSFQDVLVQPAADTPLEEILEFRTKRKDELEALRFQLEDLYLRADNTRDPVFALEHEKDRIQRALADINKVVDESFVKRVLSGFSVTLDIESLAAAPVNVIADATKGVAAGFWLGNLQLFSILGATWGLARSFVKVDFAKMRWKPRDIPKEHRDFAYLYHVSKQFRE